MGDPTLIADMVRDGVSPEIIQRVVEAILEAKGSPQVVTVLDAAAEKRKAADRERKAIQRMEIRRNPQTSTDSADKNGAPSPSPSFPPSPPSPIPPSPTPTHTPPPTPAALACEDEPKSPPAWKPTAEQLRVASWFGRRATTRWSDKELKSWKAIASSLDTGDLDALERRYTSNDPETVKYRKQEIYSLLNNWPGEVDKARRWTPPQVSNVTAKNSTDETPWFEKPELPSTR